MAFSSSNAASSPALRAALSMLAAQWRTMSPREKRGVNIAVVLLAGLFLWLVALQPAWRTVVDAPAQVDRLDAQLQRMQRLALEARELRNVPAGAGPQSLVQSAMALRAASERLGDRARLNVLGDRATLTLSGVDGAKLRAWLEEARTGARAKPVDVQLTRGPQGYQGTLTVALGGTAS